MNHAFALNALSAISDYVSWWQWLLVLVLVGLIVLWVFIRKNQQ